MAVLALEKPEGKSSFCHALFVLWIMVFMLPMVFEAFLIESLINIV